MMRGTQDFEPRCCGRLAGLLESFAVAWSSSGLGMPKMGNLAPFR
jgi:hypothetical protein